MSPMFSLEGKNAAVVGGGSGIGEAVAIGCAEQGAYVRCLDVKLDAATETAATIREAGGEADAGRVDIVDGPAVTAAFEAVAAERGSLDVVVCTPAINVRKPLLDYTDEEIDLVLGVNLTGNAHVLQAAGRIMREQGSGSIILFSSIRALVVEPGQSMYAATKAGIVQDGASRRRGARGARRACERCGPRCHRHSADGAHKGQAGVVQRIRGPQHLQALGKRPRDGGPHGLSGVRRGELRDGHGPLRRRWVDGDRR